MTVLGTLADELVDVLAEEDPLNDLLRGCPGLDHRLPDLDEATGERLRDRAVRIAAAAAGLDAESTEDTVTRGVVVQQAEAVATRVDSRLVEHTMANFNTSPVAIVLSRLAEIEPENPGRERDFLTRLAGVPEFLRAAARRHRGGVAAGLVPVESRVRAAIAQLDSYCAGSEDPLRRPVLTGGRVAGRERLLAEVVRPALAGYRDVLASEIVRCGRPDERPGLCWLPDGERTYAALARMHTTTGRGVEEMHRTGLDCLKRLADEFVAIGGPLFGVRTLAEVHERMRTDPALRWRSAREVLASARAAMDRAESAAPDWFGRLPEQRCGLEPVRRSGPPTRQARRTSRGRWTAYGRARTS